MPAILTKEEESTIWSRNQERFWREVFNRSLIKPPGLSITLASNLATPNAIPSRRCRGAGHPVYIAAEKWRLRIFRATLGKRWSEREEVWPAILMVPEKFETNPHYHALVSVAHVTPVGRGPMLQKIIDNAASEWSEFIPSGSVKIKPIETEDDVLGALDYLKKEAYTSELFARILLPKGHEWRLPLEKLRGIASS